MIKWINKKISNKVMFWMVILMSASSLGIIISTATKVQESSIQETKNNLEMLNAAMFQSLRNAMNTGDPAQIHNAEEEAREIRGVKQLIVAKSKGTIEMYSPDAKYTTNKDILKSFKTKKEQIIEIDDSTQHSLRMIKPMIATKDCLMCHANESVGDVIGVMDLTFSLEEADNTLISLITNIIITSIILGWITIAIIFYVVRGATKPIQGLKEGFIDLIESNDSNSSVRLNIDSEDEVGEVAKLFNTYMDKIDEGLKKDEIVIDEVNDVLEKIRNGFFGYLVINTAQNPHVENLKNQLNHMILHVQSTLNNINSALREYSQSHYDFKVNDKDVYGDLGSVTAGIKLVGNNTSEILAMIMNTGDQLDKSTHILSDLSSELEKSVNDQAVSGRNTTSSLDNITKSIQDTTEHTNNMADLAKNLTISASKGKELASSTAVAMNEIEQKVTSINEAIVVIDQIAFQTNILSLNAAVEAATAGEAGKGFAVVAQEVRNLASRSAEAAKDIKDIVETATSKATQGNIIANDMIQGYSQLGNDIEDTLSLIKDIANASKEQEDAIVKINMAVSRMERTTVGNAKISTNISSMSEDIQDLSNRLLSAASKASFLQDTREQVCDVDLIYSTADLKVDLFAWKDNVYKRLSDHNDNEVKEFTQLITWIDNYVSSNPDVNKELIHDIKQMGKNLQSYSQALMDANTNGESNETLNKLAKKTEIEIMRIFGNLNAIKKDKCSKL